ncbi:hypothetical protein Btru_049498 [Bulinus truncatus]|nr:hypothetical protein Btru_049498 [Bulinus truncatus]
MYTSSITCSVGHVHLLHYLLSGARTPPPLPAGWGTTSPPLPAQWGTYTSSITCSVGHVHLLHYLLSEARTPPPLPAQWGTYTSSITCSVGHVHLLHYLLSGAHTPPPLPAQWGTYTSSITCSCEESMGLDAFYSEVYNKGRTSIMTLGGTCSTVTERVAPVARLWGMLMISYSTMSPRLSDKSIFPSFFRVTSPDQYLTDGRAEIFKQLNWTKVHVIYENYHVFSTLNEIMKQDLKAVGVNVESSEMFTNDPSESVKSLRDKDARIIIASMYETKARQLACEAYRLEKGSNKTKVWYKRVVWFFPSYFDRHWMDVNDTSTDCTSTQIREVIGRYFIISYQTLWEGSDDYVSDQNITPQQFKEDYNGRALYEAVKGDIPEHFHRYFEPHTFYTDGTPYQHRAPGAYDAVWALALALNNTLTYLIQTGMYNTLTYLIQTGLYNTLTYLIQTGLCNTLTYLIQTGLYNTLTYLIQTGLYNTLTYLIQIGLYNTLTYLIQTGDCLRLEHFQYNNTRLTEIMHEAMRNVTFNSLSGPFFFNKAGDRTTDIELYQFQNVPLSYELTFLGRCHLDNAHSDDQLNCTLDKSKIVWETVDISFLPPEIPPVDGIQIQTRTLRINVYLRFCFWALASIGIILSVGLLGFNIINKSHRIVKMSSPRMNNVILVGCMMSYTTIFMLDIEGDAGACALRTFTVVIGFSLTFGALFAKTWRVYEIFTAGHKVLNTKMLRDSSLFLIVALLVVINSTILIGWMICSPQLPTLVNISTTPPTLDSDIEYINQFQRCDSQHRVQFIWTLIAIQGVVILFGTFLAIQTRNVSFPELNDSKWIALCIYHVIVLAPVSVVVVMATEDKPEINYALESSMMFLVTTMTQCLIFFPKIIAFQQDNRNQSTELDIELQLRCIKKLISFLCLSSSVKQHLMRDDSTASLEESQSTQEEDISCDVSDVSDIRHHNKSRIALGKTVYQVETGSRAFRKNPEETWPSAGVVQISYRTCIENAFGCRPENEDERHGDGKTRPHFQCNVFGDGCLYRSRSDSKVSVTNCDTGARA